MIMPQTPWDTNLAAALNNEAINEVFGKETALLFADLAEAM